MECTAGMVTEERCFLYVEDDDLVECVQVCVGCKQMKRQHLKLGSYGTLENHNEKRGKKVGLKSLSTTHTQAKLGKAVKQVRLVPWGIIKQTKRESFKF